MITVYLRQDDGTPIPLYSFDLLPDGAVTRGVAEQGEALMRLLPRGRAWPRDPEAVLGQVVRSLGGAFARVERRAADLIGDAFPASTEGLLLEWEAALGLPDPCAGPAPTVTQRRQQVMARICAQGGQSIPYFTAFAAALGFQISVTEYVPFRMGRARMGQPMAGPEWAHAWKVSTPATVIRSFRLGQGRLGERFRTWGGGVLECELHRIAPAHTTLRFAYTGPSIAGIYDQSVADRDIYGA